MAPGLKVGFDGCLGMVDSEVTGCRSGGSGSPPTRAGRRTAARFRGFCRVLEGSWVSWVWVLEGLEWVLIPGF